MADPNSVPSLLSGWSVKMSFWEYLFMCLLIALGVRVIHCLIKAWGAVHGEFNKKDKKIAGYSFGRCFILALHGCHEEFLSDLWLGTIIGFAEIMFYPLLIFTKDLSAIGGWLAIKTAGGWNVWHEQPITFNRFLIANLINLIIAYIIAKQLFF